MVVWCHPCKDKGIHQRYLLFAGLCGWWHTLRIQSCRRRCCCRLAGVRRSLLVLVLDGVNVMTALVPVKVLAVADESSGLKHDE